MQCMRTVEISGPFPMPLQTHIRSPFLSAAPISRLRRARAQEGGTILFFGFLSQAEFRSAHLDPPELIRPRKIEKGKLLFSGGRYLGSFQDNPGGHIFPEGDQQLSRQGNNQHFPNSATIELYALMKPQGQYRSGLMPYPQPGELDHGCSQPRVSSFGDALFVSDASAPPGRRRQSGISGNLPSVGKASEQSLRPQDTGEFRTNPLQTL